MKYKFVISLTSEMEANSQMDLVEKVNKMLNNNPIFNEIGKAFNIKLEKHLIEGEEDDSIIDIISKDFGVEIKTEIKKFANTAIEQEHIVHEIGGNNA